MHKDLDKRENLVSPQLGKRENETVRLMGAGGGGVGEQAGFPYSWGGDRGPTKASLPFETIYSCPCPGNHLDRWPT